MGQQSLKNRILFFLATKLGWLLIIFLAKLTRIKFIGRERFQRLKESGRPFIVCVWHGRMLLPVYLLRNENVHAIVSEHQDGEMIAQTAQKLGFTIIRGSSTRGGRKAALGLIRALKYGKIGCVVPDGPRGPRHEFKEGALFIAQRTGATLQVLTCSSNKFFELRSWDRFRIWKPFSRSVAIYSEPIEVPSTLSKAEFENLRLRIQETMISQHEEADAYFQK
ncbi:MAG: lysophospholipid acyltransferase family protein [bacterium]